MTRSMTSTTSGTTTGKKKAGASRTPAPVALPAAPDLAAFPVVGIGASAGGLEAFEAFFAGMPADADPGMAFVLVQHLAPDHASILTELVARYTRMQVFEVEDGMRVQINCAYIIPPNRDMALLNGALHLLEPAEPRGHRLPIDFLFRSLAQDQRDHAIGIVLSGTGSDGTLGVRAIKSEGGMVMVQSPDSCAFDGMPRNALATGLVDYELKAADMPAQIMAYVSHAFAASHRLLSSTSTQNENALKKIFVLLRTQTGHDFSQYKPSTCYRRIERRMAVHQLVAIEAYVKYLQQTPTELEALFRDLLIGVTSFFRDSEPFHALETLVINKLFANRPAGSTIRVWSTGCSTGEEAYSLAIVLQEQMELARQNYKLQIFATDIDSRAITSARAGVYPASMVGDISPERLARFFSAEPDGSAYRIHKSIRDLLVFSEHDLIKDPPFSKLDFISCRNVLIYMGSELQKRVISLFHYALSPGGILFLGSSETVGEVGDVFVALDRKAKLYQRNEDFQGPRRSALGRFLPPAADKDNVLLPASGKPAHAAKLSLRELTEQTLLSQLNSTAALVNGQGDILYLHGRTGNYLELVPGEAGINNILKMAREGLRRPLTTSLHKAATGKEPISVANIRVKTNGHYAWVNLSVVPIAARPATMLESSLFLVLLAEAPAPASHAAPLTVDAGTDAGALIAELHEELRAKEEYLQAANEELETTNEELMSSNEEMQSVNEELQSTNEELETSKEEMQSINEELATVNTELQSKVSDLSRVNNDMNNLLAGTGIGTIFVDHKLCILRFTPGVTQIINLIQSDVGRPVGHIACNLLGYDRLVLDAQNVLSTLIPKEIEVRTVDNKCYAMRILPYRTLDNVIEGAVITFIEITGMANTREALRQANALLPLAVVARDAQDAMVVQDMTGRQLAWNPAAVRLYGWTEAEALAMNLRERLPSGRQESALIQLLQLCEAPTLSADISQRLHKDGRIIEISVSATALVNGSGRIYAIATTERMHSETGQEPAS